MVTGLLDTSVLVDILRGYPPAVDWLSQQSSLALSPAVWLEILDGVRDAQAQSRALKLLRGFPIMDIFPTDFDWAIQQAIQFRLSHNVDVMDCLIASMAHRLNLRLFTSNLKHFEPLLGALAQKPY